MSSKVRSRKPPARKKRSSRPASKPSALPAAPRSATRSGRAWVKGALALAFLGLFAVTSLWFWARSKGPGQGQRVLVDVRAGAPPALLAEELARRGIITSPRLFSLYLRWSHGAPVPGPHLLRDDLSARELAQRLSRLPGRPSARLTFPEGYHHLQMAERLEQHEIVSAAAFRAAVHDPKGLAALGIRGPSAEGRLFPATYDLLVDSDAAQVVRTLVDEGRKRLGQLEAAHPAAFERLERDFGWGEHEILTLASIVEKEAAQPDERPLVASVFYNRLTDPDFRPARMLQSDPTAAYGCLTAREPPPSCRDFKGRVTPAMVRDARNPYNTYKVKGLPPGPIANPGEQAILAVLEPARTDYLYFVTRGNGRHTFTRTFEEHRRAIGGEGESR